MYLFIIYCVPITEDVNAITSHRVLPPTKGPTPLGNLGNGRACMSG